MQQVYVMIKMKKVIILGNCTIDTAIGMKTYGPFNIILINVFGEGTVFLAIDPDGRLVTRESTSEMTYEELSVSRERLKLFFPLTVSKYLSLYRYQQRRQCQCFSMAPVL